jgi:ABC-type protease/lipase transport system fused ATPase/permease subunit
VIGPSAAGKSTLVRLLTGVWKPSAGTVRLDGADLSQWPREDLGPHIGYVPQDVELFAGTVAENIARLGEVDSDKVVRAAQRAHVHEMILSLAEGYDTPIDPGAALLSPGQRQRIALARALYGDPKLVILDEPNSNLDGAGENALAETLRDLRGKVTVVVVTHRNTLIQHVDKMLVLDGGRVQHFGPAAGVMKAMQQRPMQPQPMPAQAAQAVQPVKLQAAGGQGGAAGVAVQITPAATAAVNTAPVSMAPAAATVSSALAAVPAPSARPGGHVVDMLETIHRGGARMGRGITP